MLWLQLIDAYADAHCLKNSGSGTQCSAPAPVRRQEWPFVHAIVVSGERLFSRTLLSLHRRKNRGVNCTLVSIENSAVFS